MTDAEHHQQELEQQEQAYDTIKADIRAALTSAPHSSSIGLVGVMRTNGFQIISTNGTYYKITIEEMQ